MFGIPELDEMIFTRLNRQDLVNCSRVNKQWHRTSIPYLWNDISHIPCKKNVAFRRIVLEDYLHEQQQHTQHPITNNLPTTLQKYSHWIQKPPRPEALYNYLETPCKAYEYAAVGNYEALTEEGKQMAAEAENPTVTAIELMRHLLGRCLNVEVDYVHLNARIYRSPDLSAITSKHFLPLAQSVRVGKRQSGYPPFTQMEARRVKSLLSRCSHNLRKLVIGYNVLIEDSESDRTKENNEKEDMEEEESTSGLRPIELTLTEYCEESIRKEFWSWLWKRCGSLELLDLLLTKCNVQNLAEGVRNHMPNLQKIRLGTIERSTVSINDSNVATLLSSCQKGWKSIEIRHDIEFYEASKSALAKSYPILELFTAPFMHFESSYLVHLLRSAPNLRALNTIHDGWFDDMTPAEMDSESFVDMCPYTGSLKMWECEGSLKELRVMLKGIPRPDLGKQNGAVEETHSGQSRDIQHRVYDRLARLTKLEKLWLGHFASLYRSDAIKHDQSQMYQVECLEMSLNSGLERLKGLKELEELSLAYMNTRIGMDEIRWMAENWPKLRIIRGLDGVGSNISKAGFIKDKRDKQITDYYCDIDGINEWLKENYPRLRILRSQEQLDYNNLMPH
ncbi:hypothetical protein BGZ46_003628 [Entomortierella lignicola]|nr:hypothetical protein BGZ46_003628 [Entomortierella lignicola]